jgi:hypothetical protein
LHELVRRRRIVNPLQSLHLQAWILSRHCGRALGQRRLCVWMCGRPHVVKRARRKVVSGGFAAVPLIRRYCGCAAVDIIQHSGLLRMNYDLGRSQRCCQPHIHSQGLFSAAEPMRSCPRCRRSQSWTYSRQGQH